MTLTVTGTKRNHPLSRLFKAAVNYGLGMVGIRDPFAVDYISYDILVNFVHIADLYRLRGVSGKSLRDVGEFLAEADRLSQTAQLSVEMEVRRHTGDFILFWIGLFPEAVGAGILGREDKIIGGGHRDIMRYYVTEAKECYRLVSRVDKRFRRLSDNFEFYIPGLHHARACLDTCEDPNYSRVVDRLLR